MDRSFPLGDEGSFTVGLGPYLLGVRFSTPSSSRWLGREICAPAFHAIAAMLQGAAWAVSPSFTVHDLAATFARVVRRPQRRTLS
jgi:hypothetical protein